MLRRKHWKTHKSFISNTKISYKNWKNGEEITKKKKSYRVLFIDSPRSIASSLSNLVKNLAKEIHKNKCKYEHGEKKVKLGELNINIARVQYADLEYDLIEHKCCSSNYQKIWWKIEKTTF